MVLRVEPEQLERAHRIIDSARDEVAPVRISGVSRTVAQAMPGSGVEHVVAGSAATIDLLISRLSDKLENHGGAVADALKMYEAVEEDSFARFHHSEGRLGNDVV